MLYTIATNLFAFVIVLGFLIFVHEAGHFLVAKLFGVRVLVFSFGFGRRLFGFERGGTDYRVSLIPLGGYVRMAGDIPEEGEEHAPDEFLSRPKWQRFLILFAGPAMNIVIAVLFLTLLNMAGLEMLKENEPVLGAVVEGRPAAKAGLKTGDRIVEANGQKLETWDDLKLAISLNPNTPVRLIVRRGTSELSTVIIPEKQMTEYGIAGVAGVQKFLSTEVGRVIDGSPAALAGVRAGDRIISVAGREVSQLVEMQEQLEKFAKTNVTVGIDRAGQKIALTLPAAGSSDSLRGIFPPTEIRKLAFVPAVRDSIDQNIKMVRYAWIVISRLFKMQGSVKEFSGPIDIARISGEMFRTGWKAVVYLMAGISLQLGIMNLLPIPVLDGGHIAILAVEGVARRELSIAVKERVQQIGFAMLAALMLVVLYNDVIKNFLLMRQ
ncbi:MAG: site-2 protease family protein [Acidobacteria bacterium]|nr:site-2 protease family protein [Acidobacteriota bacterium]